MTFLHHVAHDFDATRHFLAGQVHPGNWFGNIVAGVVVWAVVDVIWQWKLKAIYEAWVHRMHLKALAEHHRTVVQPAMDAHHADMKDHVSLTMGAKQSVRGAKKVPAKKSPAKKAAAAKTAKRRGAK